MPRPVILVATLMAGCSVGPHAVERRTLASGRAVGVLGHGVTGSGPYRNLYLEYQSDARDREGLLAEIHDVWANLRQEADGLGVPIVSIDARSATQRVFWDGWKPFRAAQEKGCVSYSRESDGSWAESPLACCHNPVPPVGACEVAEGRLK
jgi:hypothetical protein